MTAIITCRYFESKISDHLITSENPSIIADMIKKLLLLIAGSAVFLHFYPQPELTRWFNQHKTSLITGFSAATDTKVRLKSEIIYTELSPQFNQFSTGEQQYLYDITRSRQSVIAFYQKFCKTQRHTSKLHRNNQVLVCKKISSYKSLF